MKIPNCEKAIIDTAKLTEYTLNPEHPRGKHKALLFKDLLGIELADANTLLSWIREALLKKNAELGLKDQFGQRYVLDFSKTHLGREVTIRTTWIIRTNENFPRMVSCFIF